MRAGRGIFRVGPESGGHARHHPSVRGQGRAGQCAGPRGRAAALRRRRPEPPVHRRGTHSPAPCRQLQTRPDGAAAHPAGLRPADSHAGHLPGHTDAGRSLGRHGVAGHLQPTVRTAPSQTRPAAGPPLCLAHRGHRDGQHHPAPAAGRRAGGRQLVPPSGRPRCRPSPEGLRHLARRHHRSGRVCRTQIYIGRAVASRMLHPAAGRVHDAAV